MAANVGVFLCYQLHHLQRVFTDDVWNAVGLGEIPNRYIQLS
jgi:hypothetical protein